MSRYLRTVSLRYGTEGTAIARNVVDLTKAMSICKASELLSVQLKELEKGVSGHTWGYLSALWTVWSLVVCGLPSWKQIDQ